MVKSELIQKLSDANPHLNKNEVELLVSCVLDEIAHSLENGNRVELRGFGTFYIRDRQARQGRNPKTGASVVVDAKSVPRFRPSRSLVERMAAPESANSG